MREFHKLPREKRRQTVADQGLLYKGISFSTIGDIFDSLYERSIGGRDPGLTLAPNCDVTDIQSRGLPADLKIGFGTISLVQQSTVEADAVIRLRAIAMRGHNGSTR